MSRDARIARARPGRMAPPVPAGRSKPGAFQAVLPRGGERLVQVLDDVVDVLDADREPHQILGDAGGCELLGRELAVGGGGRMGGEGLGVADVDQPGDELQRVDEPSPPPRARP